MAVEELRVTRAAEIREQPEDEHRWLVEPLWGGGAVGIFAVLHRPAARSPSLQVPFKAVRGE